MNVGYTRAASATIVRVVRNGKEADTLLEVSSFDDFLVEVMDDWDVESGGA